MNVLAISSCIVLLSSDKKILHDFIEIRENKENLAKLLSLAWPEPSESTSNFNFVRDARSKSLAFLSLHETRLGYLMGLLRDIAFRTQILDSPSDLEWKAKIDYPATVKARV